MKKTTFWRFLEILPGALVWISFVLPVLISFLAPAVVATYILLFDLFWFYKSVVVGSHLIYGYRRLRHDMKVDWLEKLGSVKTDHLIKNWKEIYNAVIFATYKESIETLEASIEAILESNFPLKKIIFVLATEERDKENARRIAAVLKEKYKNHFFNFLVTEHPDGIVGENKAKGANVTWAAKELKKFLDREQIEYENVIVTTADADTRLHRQYLSCLTYKYVTEPNRDRRSFQPITLYSNNIWQAPAMSRIVAFSNSFWQMVEATRSWRLINFATHAMSMKMLVEIDYWAVEVVNEDSRQYWRAYFRFNGDHKVVPIFIPVYMDAVLAHSYWGTMKNQYLQKQRWAYGVEHFPYIVTESIKNKAVPWSDKFVRIYRMFEGNFSWATASIYIAVMAWMPLLFGAEFKHTVLGANLISVIRNLMMFTWGGIFISILLSLYLLPPKPPGFRKRKSIEMVAQWILVPVQAIIFSSFPAIDAQTRFMLGKYLTFHVTEKKAVVEETAKSTAT